MAWESRGRFRYLYKSNWRDGRVIKEYLGRGPAALLARQIDEQARLRREAEARALRTEEARLVPSEASLRELDIACRLMTEATLMSAGYDRVNYEWRRRRARPRP